jgi:hypothetical protein
MNVPPSGAIEAVQRTFEDGLHVILMIRMVGDSFEVVSSAESRSSGPCETVVGSAPTLTAARELVCRQRLEWERSPEDPPLDLRDLKLV